MNMLTAYPRPTEREKQDALRSGEAHGFMTRVEYRGTSDQGWKVWLLMVFGRGPKTCHELPVMKTALIGYFYASTGKRRHGEVAIGEYCRICRRNEVRFKDGISLNRPIMPMSTLHHSST